MPLIPERSDGLLALGAGLQGFLKGMNDMEDRKMKKMELESKFKVDQQEREKKNVEQNFQRENALRDEWLKNGTTTRSQQIKEAHDRLVSAPNTPAGDMSLIYSLNKIMDPGSTVREGEFANAQATTSAMGQLQSFYRKAMTGQRLTPEQRRDFMNTASQLLAAQRGNQNTFDRTYSGLAEGYGIKPGNVVLKIFEDPQTGEKKAVPVSAQTGQPVAGGQDGLLAKPKGLVKSAPTQSKDYETMSDEELQREYAKIKGK